MRPAAAAVLALALSTAVPPRAMAMQVRAPAAGPDEARQPAADPFERLLEQPPRVTLRPTAALLDDGTHEQRLNVRATWPAADTSPDFALHLLAGFAAIRETYSRSGLAIDTRHDFGPVRMMAAAVIAAGSGAGPARSITVALRGGLPAVGFELRSTWLHGRASATVRTVGPEVGLPEFPYSRRDHGGNYTDGEVHALHRLGRAALRLTAGRRFSGESHGTREWFLGEADVPVWRRIGVLLGGGVRPERADLAQPGGRFAQLAFRVDIGAAPPPPRELPPPVAAPPAMSATPIEAGRYLLGVHLPVARSVELTGDVTDWNVVALRRSVDGTWETLLEKPAGTYHVNIRVDGGDWIVPHGLIAVPDRFGGSVGILNLPQIEEVNDATQSNRGGRICRAARPCGGGMRRRTDRTSVRPGPNGGPVRGDPEHPGGNRDGR